MDITEFPECCGIHIVSGFDYSYDDYDDQPDRSEIKATKNELQTYININKTKVAALMLILNKCQHKWYGRMVREVGFKCLSSNYKNPNTGSRLYLYQYLYRPYFK